jgi:hypothetical protein
LYDTAAAQPTQNGNPAGARRPPNNQRAATPSQNENEYEQRIPSPPPRSQSRNGLPSRPASPANSSRGNASARAPQRQGLAPSSSPQPQSRIRTARRPSNAASTSGQIPSINLQTSSRSIPTEDRDRRVSSDSLAVNRPPKDDPVTPASVYPARAPSPLPRPPKRTGTVGAPSDGVSSRRDPNARVSFFDPGNQAALDRLITSVPNDGDGEEETAQAMMSNVEEMIEGYEWAIDDVIGRKSSRGAADLIEARLLDELMALDKVHSLLSSTVCATIHIG